MNNIFYIAYIVILIWSLYDIWTGRKDTGMKIVWTLVCLFLGPIGTIIYVWQKVIG